jgi:hypothetical protein
VAIRGWLRIAPGHIPIGVSLVHECFPDLLIVQAFGAGPLMTSYDTIICPHHVCLRCIPDFRDAVMPGERTRRRI